jgi:hypothetical protein
MDDSEAEQLTKALRGAAERELLRLADIGPASEIDIYRASLLKLLYVAPA